MSHVRYFYSGAMATARPTSAPPTTGHPVKKSKQERPISAGEPHLVATEYRCSAA
jgi:hypothetical protein